MDEAAHNSGVRPVTWGTWCLLLSSGVLMTLVSVEGYPQGPVLDTNPPIYPGPSPGDLVVWAATGLFVLGAAGIWAGVAGHSRSVGVDGVALAAAVLFAALSAPIYVHHCVYINGLRWFYPPSWVFGTAVAAWLSGWVVGLPLLIVVRQQQLARAADADPAAAVNPPKVADH